MAMCLTVIIFFYLNIRRIFFKYAHTYIHTYINTYIHTHAYPATRLHGVNSGYITLL